MWTRFPTPSGATHFHSCSSSLYGMFSNLLDKVLLMLGFLEVDTVRALFPHSPPPAPGSGRQLRAPSGTVAAKVDLGLQGEQSQSRDSGHHGPGAYLVWETRPVTSHKGTHRDAYEDPQWQRGRRWLSHGPIASGSQTWNKKRAIRRRSHLLGKGAALHNQCRPPSLSTPRGRLLPIHGSSTERSTDT